MKRIEAAFVMKNSTNTHFNWWWESFKRQRHSIYFENGKAYNCLDTLLDEHEKVWFVACDSGYDPSKFWLFEATVKTIKLVVSEHYAFEYYIVSKKYDWLLCETHHDTLVGLGSVIPKMKQMRSIKQNN